MTHPQSSVSSASSMPTVRTVAAPAIAIEQWPARLEAAIASCTLLKRVIVFRETDSTQSAAQRMNSHIGDVVTAWKQTAGQGRLGRRWIDPNGEGIAVTLVIGRDEPERLAIAAAVGVAQAAESLLGGSVGIKWPNDLVVNQRKLAGILIEQAGGRAMIGIGMNVSQTSWPADSAGVIGLAGRAVSLAQLGCAVDRVQALAALLPAVDSALRADGEQLSRDFAARDALSGTIATLRHDGRNFTGRVNRID